MNRRALLALVIIVLSASRLAAAESAIAPTQALSPELRAAFTAEMQRLDTGLQAAVSAIARADWPAVEKIAGEIQGSFILEQKLSPKQLAELHRVLPEAFLALDRHFHAQAERLAHAARARDGELAAFRVYKLTESCVSCHSQYARHRFQSVTAPPEAHRH
jgi:hypothetical protein